MQLNDGKERPVLPAGTLRRMLAVIDSRSPRQESAELSEEHMRALRESHQYACEEAFFAPRPVIDGATERQSFEAGFERGWGAAIAVLRAAGSSDEDRRDAERFRWLCEDHADAETRQKCRHILEHMGVRSYSANSAAIDGAMRAAGGEG